MKTASRIVGTAAFRQGYQAQDSPVYGAERRGAPMTAFTRFDTHAILERGVVSSPDLIVVADGSLLDDPLVRPLQGLSANGTVLINSTHPHETVASVVHDFTGLALEHTGTASALSVALGTAAAKLAGLELGFVEQAVREELQGLKLDASRLEKNLELARASFVATPALRATPIQPQNQLSLRLVEPKYERAWLGTASVAAHANTPLRQTGDWRVMRPVVDLERCTHCWMCFVSCPDGAITLGPADIQIDYGVCKGCLICAQVCPIDAVEIEREA